MKPARIAVLVSVIPALPLLAAGPGTRLGLWDSALLGTAFVPWNALRQARAAADPPHHHDTERPPQFVAILASQASALNPVDYGGPDVARAQAGAYPDLRPHRLGLRGLKNRRDKRPHALDG